jgi:hypothetical protein
VRAVWRSQHARHRPNTSRTGLRVRGLLVMKGSVVRIRRVGSPGKGGVDSPRRVENASDLLDIGVGLSRCR